MSDHGPPAKPSRRGTAAGFDPYEWVTRVSDILDDLPSQPNQQDDEAAQDYKLFKENERVRKATEADLKRLMQEGKWKIIAEFKYFRPELRKWVEQLETQWFDDHNNRMSE